PPLAEWNTDCGWPACASAKSDASCLLLVIDENPSSSIVSELAAFTITSAPNPGWNPNASWPAPATVTVAGGVPAVLLAGVESKLKLKPADPLAIACCFGGSITVVPPLPSPDSANVE